MEAVVGIVGGALLGAAVSELLKEVRQAKDVISSFQTMFQRLESTLISIIPSVDAIISLSHKLDSQQHKLEELEVILRYGISLVKKCRQTSRISYHKKLQYGKELTDLNDKLKDYFLTLLPLDHFRNDLEMLNLVRDLHTKLVAGSPTNLPDDDVFLSTAAYCRKGGENLYLFKWYPHNLGWADLTNCKFLCNGENAINYLYKTKFGDVLLKNFTHDVKISKKDFQERMEEIGKIGQCPNIAVPFGYSFSERDKFVLYDYAPSGTLASYLKEPTPVGTRLDWNNRLSIILGVAKGINHIHSESGIVHGNIKSSNILLNVGQNGCISDFRLVPMKNSPKHAAAAPIKKHRIFAPQSSAPELHGTEQATQQSDVYDFGVMLGEILSLYHKHLFFHPNEMVEELKILGIVHKCTERDCRKRPKMDDVVKMIQKVISKEDTV